MKVKVIGAGLAGSEAAWQLANRGIEVALYEMKPKKMTPAHHSEDFAELVCSNSLRGDRLGQGGGYYDRLLPQLACPTCLICREQLMSEAVPTEEHDRRCTLYVTERGVMEPET